VRICTCYDGPVAGPRVEPYLFECGQDDRWSDEDEEPDPAVPGRETQAELETFERSLQALVAEYSKTPPEALPAEARPYLRLEVEVHADGPSVRLQSSNGTTRFLSLDGDEHHHREEIESLIEDDVDNLKDKRHHEPQPRTRYRGDPWQPRSVIGYWTDGRCKTDKGRR